MTIKLESLNQKERLLVPGSFNKPLVFNVSNRWMEYIKQFGVRTSSPQTTRPIIGASLLETVATTRQASEGTRKSIRRSKTPRQTEVKKITLKTG